MYEALLTGNTFVITVLAFVSALIVGAIIIVLATPEAAQAWRNVFSAPGEAVVRTGNAIANAYGSLFSGSIGNPSVIARAFRTGKTADFVRAFQPLSETLVSTTPLVLSGLGIALAFRAGLFDIGGQGQVILGAAGAVLAGFSFPALPVAVHLPLAIIAGAAFGAAWGFIPGFLKARTGAHEVITSMMLNYVGLNLLTYLLQTEIYQAPPRVQAISKTVVEAARLPHIAGAALRVNAGVLLAVGLVLGVAWLLQRSTLGFRFRMLGLNRDAARVSGVAIERHYVLAMTLAGMLVGLAGAFMILGVDFRMAPLYGGTTGFDGITIADPGPRIASRGRAVRASLRRIHRGRQDHAGEHGHPSPARPGAAGRPRAVRGRAGSHPDHLSHPGFARGTESVRRVGGMSSERAAGLPGPAPERKLRKDLAAIRRRGFAIALFVLAAIVLLLFALGTSPDQRTMFQFNAPPASPLPVLSLPVLAVLVAIGIACALLGFLQMFWRSNKRTYLLLGTGLALTGVAFLAWSGRNATVDVEGLLLTMLIQTVPLTLGALSGLLCERSGVINIAIEGQFLIAAFFGALIASATHNLWAGLVAGAAAGGLIGLMLGVFTITYGADQIIVGVVLDAFALGLTSFFLQSLLVPHQAALNSPAVFGPISIPLLDQIPVIGPILFNQNIFVYLTIIILVVVQLALFSTRWGLRVRAVGEHPRAADTVGINVNRIRYGNVILGGIVAGIGGASFTIGSTGQFAPNMTSGLGYIALAAMIFGRWRPLGALGAALLFGFSDALQFTLSVLNVPIPSPFLSMFPYLATILAVAGLVGRVIPPAADGQPYVRE